MYVYLDKTLSIISHLLTARELLVDEMIGILNEIGDAMFETAIRDLNAAKSSSDPLRLIWSAAHHLDLAYEIFGKSCSKSSLFRSRKVADACNKATISALLVAICYKTCNEQKLADDYTELAAKSMGSYMDEMLRGDSDKVVHHSGAVMDNPFSKRREIEGDGRRFANVMRKIRSDGQAFIIRNNGFTTEHYEF